MTRAFALAFVLACGTVLIGCVDIIPDDPQVLARKTAEMVPVCSNSAQCDAMWAYVKEHARPGHLFGKPDGCPTTLEETEVSVAWDSCSNSGGQYEFHVTRTPTVDGGFRFDADVARIGCDHLVFRCAPSDEMKYVYYEALGEIAAKYKTK